MFIDPRFDALLTEEPDRLTDVMVVYTKLSDSLRARLESAGMRDLQHSLAGTFFVGKIRVADLSRLETIDAIESIHSNEPVQALPELV